MWPSQVSKGQRYETSKAERTAKESRNLSIANSSETGSAFLYQNFTNKLDIDGEEFIQFDTCRFD